MTTAPTTMPAITPVDRPDELELEFELLAPVELALLSPPVVWSRPPEVLGDSVTVVEVEELEEGVGETLVVVEEVLVVFEREVVVVVP